MSERCRTCGDSYPQAGDGWDGECPNCADRSFIRSPESLADLGEVEVIRENVRLVLEWIGEGKEGDYDSDDPEDTPLCRFSVHGRPGTKGVEPGHEGEDWAPFENASYCTQILATLDEDRLEELAEELMQEVFEATNQGHSIKKRCERLSWMDERGLVGMGECRNTVHPGELKANPS